MERTVLFVCPHGAGKSRIAAAFFDRAAPEGWRADSAGLEPDPVVSPRAVALLADTDAESTLDHSAPRGIEAVATPALIVTIDCAVSGAAERWDLCHGDFDGAMRGELRERVERLVQALG